MTISVFIASLSPVASAVALLISIFLILALPLWSVVDCIQDQESSPRRRSTWIAVVLLGPGIGSILYGLFASHSRFLKLAVGLGMSGLVTLAFLFFISLAPKQEPNALRRLNPESPATALPLEVFNRGKYLGLWGAKPRTVTVFTKSGRNIQDLVSRPLEVNHVAEDRNGVLYGLTNENFGRFEPSTGELEPQTLPGEFAQVTGFSGLAFDPKNDRFLMISAAGVGRLLEYSPRTTTWKQLGWLKQTYQGLAYDPESQVFYTLLLAPGAKRLDSIVVLDDAGKPAREILISPSLAIPKERKIGPRIQLSYSDGTIALILEGPGLKELEDGLFFVDKRTGVVTRTANASANARNSLKPARRR